jgi:alkylated DNA repair dioxygenase AlkB
MEPVTLSLNCVATYYKAFITKEEASQLFDHLIEIVKSKEFAPRTVYGEVPDVNFGKTMFVDQDLLDKNVFPEFLWGPVTVWTDKLLVLKDKIEEAVGEKFQVCVLIYYPDGNSGVAYHSDFVAFGDTTIIPSISLGEEREFRFREKETGAEFPIVLQHGSMVIMGEHCQDRYEHSLPIDPRYKNPRINLTFRKYGFDD